MIWKVDLGRRSDIEVWLETSGSGFFFQNITLSTQKHKTHVYASTTRELRAFARVFRRKSEERREDVRKKHVVVSLDYGHHHQSARNQRLAANNRRKRRGDEEISVERSPTGSYSGHGGLCKRRGTNSRGGKSRRAVAMDIFLVFWRVFFCVRVWNARADIRAMS